MSGNKDFVIDSHGVLKKYVGKDLKVVIPTSVVEIGYKTFFNNSTIEEVVIPNTVEEIGVKAFCGCNNLKFVSLPTFYTKVQGLSFGGCTGLTDVVITSIGDELELVRTRTKKLYEALNEKYPDKDFAQIYKLICKSKSSKNEGVISNDNATPQTPQDDDLSNDNSSNASVVGVTEVTEVEEIGETLRVFLDETDKRCEELIDCNIDDDFSDSFQSTFGTDISNYKIGTRDMDIFDINFIRKMAKLAEIDLKPKLSTEHIMLFLTPDMVEEQLDIARYSDSYNDIAKVAFFGCDNLINVQLPNLATCIGQFVFGDCFKLKIIQGKSKLTHIEFAGFENCNELEFIRISNDAIIADDAFNGCSKLDCNGNLIGSKTVSEELDLQYISVYETERGPSHIRALKFYDKQIMPITDVINGLKTGTIKSDDVWLKEGTTLCIDDKVYKRLSKKFSYNKLAEGLFYYDNAGLGTKEKAMHAYSSFRYGYSWYNNNNIAIVPLKYIDGCEVTSMDSLMSNLSSGTAIDTLDLTHFDTENVTNMFKMFAGLTDVNSIVFGKSFDTSNVTSMSGMFQDCSSLKYLSVDNFKTSNVLDMSYMFSGCTSLLEVELSGFDTTKVVNMTGMFDGCSNLSDFTLNYFNTKNVSNTRKMLPKTNDTSATKTVLVPLNQTNIQLTELLSFGIDNNYNFVVPLC